MKKKLHTYGEHRVFPKKMSWLKKEGWYLTSEEEPADKEQQKFLEYLGWGKDTSLTVKGANVLIGSILEMGEDD